MVHFTKSNHLHSEIPGLGGTFEIPSHPDFKRTLGPPGGHHPHAWDGERVSYRAHLPTAWWTAVILGDLSFGCAEPCQCHSVPSQGQHLGVGFRLQHDQVQRIPKGPKANMSSFSSPIFVPLYLTTLPLGSENKAG